MYISNAGHPYGEMANARIVAGSGVELYPAQFSPDEEQTFRQDFETLADSLQSLSRDLRDLMLADMESYLYAARLAKGSLNPDLKFVGLGASNAGQLGMQLIRAITVRNVGITSGTPVQNWIQVYTSTGWTNLFGSPTAPVSLSQTGLSGASATNLQNRVVLAFDALIDPVTSPKVSEYRLHVGPTDYPVQTISWMPLTNLFYTKLLGMVFVGKNNSFYMRGNVQPSAGQDNLQLFGLTFATGDYLLDET